MSIWNRTPMIRILIPFLIGIFCAVYFDFSLPFANLILGLLFCILIFCAFLIQYKSLYKYEWLLGLFFTISLFAAGYQITIVHKETNRTSHFSHIIQPDSLSRCVVQITETPIIKEKSIKVISNVISVVNKIGKAVNTTGSLLIYIQKDGLSEKLKTGDKIAIVSKIDIPKLPQNPAEFDYKRVLALKNIHYQSYVKANTWECIDSTSSTLNAFFASIQNKMYHLLDNDILTDNQKAVMGALVLGYTDEIDSEIIQSFSNTGLIHILSVSGMNVGFVYVVIELFLFLLPFLNRRKWLRGIIIISMLWMYALVTGFSPSVVRAAMMFSFIVLGKTMLRNVNIYNTLAGSAFIILLFNPYLLFNIGFQLSYMAVLGIVCFQKELCLLVHRKNKILNFIWDIITVTITAQLFTFPLCLFYFHQFPNYFLLANLLVIPLTTILIYLGIALMLISPFPIVAKYLALLISWILKFMFGFVSWVEHLPNAVSTNVPFGLIDLIIVFVLLSLLVAIVKNRKALFIHCFLGVAIIWFTIGIYKLYALNHQKTIIVYSLKGKTAVDFINGRSHLLLGDCAIIEDAKLQRFYMNNNWMQLGLKRKADVNINVSFKNSELNICKSGHILMFDKLKMLILDKEQIGFENKLGVKEDIDVLLVTNNAVVDFEELSRSFNIKNVVVDLSNYRKNTLKIADDCRKFALPFYNMENKGAFVQNFGSNTK